jgi:hypothetical protein
VLFPADVATKAKLVKAKIARGEAILSRLLECAPVWAYLIKMTPAVKI